jgi:AraC family transcriptional regulator, regulatory protein of adaptative response / DNA-3-methyladenine glycosylase II
MDVELPGDLELDRAALDRARWSRDARFDGKFFIAVTSTGIYCRPICPSPTSKSSNVRYYPSAAAAAEAGFRPCLRCRPEAAPGTAAWLGTSAAVRRALRLIEEGVLDSASVEELATRIGVGRRHLHRLFMQHIGASPSSVAQTRRLHFAKRLIDETTLPITEIAFASGFKSVRRFNDVFRHTYARSPRELRRHRRIQYPDDDCLRLRLAYRPPYDWQAVLGFLASRAIPGVEHVSEHTYSRTVRLETGMASIAVRALDRTHALELEVRGAPPAALLQLSSHARRVFDVVCDPARVAAALSGDPLLAPLIKSAPGMRIPGSWDAFECAACAIIQEGTAGTRSRESLARLVRQFGTTVETRHSLHPQLTHVFPTPAAIVDADLSGLGISQARATALRTLARTGACARVEQYVALRVLAEPDAFPARDLALRRAAGSVVLPLKTRFLLKRAERWRPWRGYAAMYLWAHELSLRQSPPRRARIAAAPAGPARKLHADSSGGRPLAAMTSSESCPKVGAAKGAGPGVRPNLMGRATPR